MAAITECKFMEQEIWKKGMELSKETYALVKKAAYGGTLCSVKPNAACFYINSK